VTKWGSVGSGDGQFQSLRDLTADSLGNIYATDSTNQRVQKFTNTGVYITKWAQWGQVTASLTHPMDYRLVHPERYW
jgi:tripartite motif-containing protein 71